MAESTHVFLILNSGNCTVIVGLSHSDEMQQCPAENIKTRFIQKQIMEEIHRTDVKEANEGLTKVRSPPQGVPGIFIGFFFCIVIRTSCRMKGERGHSWSRVGVENYPPRPPSLHLSALSGSGGLSADDVGRQQGHSGQCHSSEQPLPKAFLAPPRFGCGVASVKADESFPASICLYPWS